MRYSELIENLDHASDEELFGELPTKLSTWEQALMKFKMHYSVVRRVPDRDNQVQDALERIFHLTRDRKFDAGENYGHAGWFVHGYTALGEPVAALNYWDSGGGSWTYIGARYQEDLDRALQMLYDIGALESPDAKKKRIAAQRQRKLDAAEKKGIRVGTRIRLSWYDEEVIGTVTKINPTGKIFIQYTHPGWKNQSPQEITMTAHGIRKADVLGENKEPSDEELFGDPLDRLERVDFSSIEIDGVDRRDFPDFVDAYVSYAEWNNGNPLTDEELEWLTNELHNNGELNSMVHDRLYEEDEPSDEELFGDHELAHFTRTPMSQVLDMLNDHDYDSLSLEHDFSYGHEDPEADAAILTDYLKPWGIKIHSVRVNPEDEDDPLVTGTRDTARERAADDHDFYPMNEDDEPSDDDLFGTRNMYYVNIMGNYNTGRYSDYGGRRYIVPGASPEDAVKWLKRNADWVYMYMDSQKFPNGKRVVRRPARDNVFIDQSTVFAPAPEGSNSAIENFIRKHRAV